tara:strand:+ start:384 stop:1769 length:1386 start_codon:yes stop_codon:yes gene_type:complete
MKAINDKKWFEKVRVNSWEVEILIVACILAFLFNIPNSLDNYILQLKVSDHSDFRGFDKGSNNSVWYRIGAFKSLIILGLMFCIETTKITFCIYIFLRGFWVSAIGISSVFPKGISLKELNFSSRFHKLLPQDTFDDFIVRIDNICSSIFGLGFLIALLFFSMIFYSVVSSAFTIPIWYIFEGHLLAKYVIFFLMGLGLIFFLDILLLGLFKKIKWKVFSYPYSWVYKLLRVVTLFFIYESMYYLYISNVRLRVILFFWLSFIIIILTSVMLDSDGYISFSYNDLHQSKSFLSNHHYEDRLLASGDNFSSTGSPFINSEIISESYLKLIIPFQPYIHSSLDSACGITSQISADDQNIENEILLDCINNVYAIYIDNDTIVSDFVFYNYYSEDVFINTFFMPISVSKYHEGKHILSVEKLFAEEYVFPEEDSTVVTDDMFNVSGILSKATDSLIHIPFYIYR